MLIHPALTPVAVSVVFQAGMLPTGEAPLDNPAYASLCGAKRRRR